LFGASLFLFGAGLCLSLILKQKPQFFDELAALLVVIFLLLVAMMSLDLFGARSAFTIGSFSDFSALLSTHRLLIIQLPFVLLASAIITLYVYGEKIVDDHAKDYRYATMVSIWSSFFIFLLIGFESMI
jgi:hypothetical protein